MVSLSPASPPASSSRSPAFMSSTSQDHLEEEDCTECLVNCQDPACVSELSQQCTDDCFIVPCDDPNHSALCMDEECAALCDSSADCSFTHRPIDSLQQQHAHATTQKQPSPYNWDMMAGQGLSIPSSSYHGINQHPPSFNKLMDDSAYSFLPSGHSSPSSMYTPPLHEPISHSHLQHRCQWNDCHMSFFSLPELTNHVNSQHLRISSNDCSSVHQSSNLFNFSSAFPSPSQPYNPQNNTCQWNECPGFNVPPPIQTGTPDSHAVNAAAEIVAHHVLNDHLGMDQNSAMQAINYLMSIPHDCPLARYSKSAQQQQQQQQQQLSQPPQQEHVHHALSPPSPSSPPLSGIGLEMDHEAECDECTTGAHRCHWKDCTEVYTTVDALTEHITATHVGGGKAHYECFWNDCPRNGEKGFSSKQKICRHIQTHTGHRPFLCTVCKQSFSEAATLQQHMRRHTQEKPYSCDFPGCGKAFAIAGALTIHKRIHNGLKPFKCTYCDRAFSESSNLSKHLRTHTGVRPYSCAEAGCGKSFSRPDQLARHMKVHRKKTEAVETEALVVS